MTPEVRVRPAVPGDAAGIRSVADRAWHAAHEPIVGADAVEEFLAEYYDRGTLRSAAADPETILHVAVRRSSDGDDGDGTDDGGTGRSDGGGTDSSDGGGEGAADATAPEVVGFAMASPGEDGDTYHLGRIYVAPDRWGEGVGRRLLETVEDRIRDRGGERVELAVMAGNDRAVAFYEAAGYRRVGEFHDDRIDTRSFEYAKGLARTDPDPG